MTFSLPDRRATNCATDGHYVSDGPGGYGSGTQQRGNQNAINSPFGGQQSQASPTCSSW